MAGVDIAVAGVLPVSARADIPIVDLIAVESLPRKPGSVAVVSVHEITGESVVDPTACISLRIASSVSCPVPCVPCSVAVVSVVCTRIIVEFIIAIVSLVPVVGVLGSFEVIPDIVAVVSFLV